MVMCAYCTCPLWSTFRVRIWGRNARIEVHEVVVAAVETAKAEEIDRVDDDARTTRP